MAVGMGAGFASRVVIRLEDLGLFEAWAERYDFERHHVIRGNVAARSGEEMLSRMSGAFSAAGVEHVATRIARAWLLAHCASFRLVTYYVAELPGQDLLAGIGFQAAERGANLWLALPRDEGVFQGMDLRYGIPCASPVQVLLDLRTHPERASEAAGRLDETLLGWRRHD